MLKDIVGGRLVQSDKKSRVHVRLLSVGKGKGCLRKSLGGYKQWGRLMFPYVANLINEQHKLLIVGNYPKAFVGNRELMHTGLYQLKRS